jgi:hypothetical protein
MGRKEKGKVASEIKSDRKAEFPRYILKRLEMILWFVWVSPNSPSVGRKGIMGI